MDYAYTSWSTGGALILALSELGHETKVTVSILLKLVSLPHIFHNH